MERELWVGEVGGWVPDSSGRGEWVEVGGGGASIGCCYFSMPCNSVGFVVLDLMSFLVDGCFVVYLFLFFSLCLFLLVF